MREPELNDNKATTEGSASEEWQNRRLCSDENCIGVIGPDGRCKECGRPYKLGVIPDAPIPEPGPSSSPAAEEADPPSASDDSAETDAEWGNRRLCSDGNCIGVIGPGGRCRECGKPYAG
jgi:hypothetical protein